MWKTQEGIRNKGKKRKKKIRNEELNEKEQKMR